MSEMTLLEWLRKGEEMAIKAGEDALPIFEKILVEESANRGDVKEEWFMLGMAAGMKMGARVVQESRKKQERLKKESH